MSKFEEMQKDIDDLLWVISQRRTWLIAEREVINRVKGKYHAVSTGLRDDIHDAVREDQDSEDQGQDVPRAFDGSTERVEGGERRIDVC